MKRELLDEAIYFFIDCMCKNPFSDVLTANFCELQQDLFLYTYKHQNDVIGKSIGFVVDILFRFCSSDDQTIIVKI